MAREKTEEFILLPPRGLTVREDAPVVFNLFRALSSPGPPTRVAPALEFGMKVLDSIHENGAKLISLKSDSVSALRAGYPGLRIVPVSYYKPALAPRPTVGQQPKASGRGRANKLTIKVLSRIDSQPVVGVSVRAFLNFENRIGDQGITDHKGEVHLSFGSNNRIDRLYIYPTSGYWNVLLRDLKIISPFTVQVTPLDLEKPDGLRIFYDRTALNSGHDVVVAVVDTGIGQHDGLRVEGGRNTVTGESDSEFGDNGLEHGTHVAGIIAGRGSPPLGMRGLAPGVTLRSYRVFGNGQDTATNFAISKAIYAAVEDNCDLINMSLAGGSPDPATSDAIAFARSKGALVIAAAGNDGRAPVTFPASDSLSIAVSAMGRKGTFPTLSAHQAEVAKPFGTDSKNFVAAFSNVGSDVDLIAPGVAIISTVNGGYSAWDGTSMACPAVTGIVARELAKKPGIRNMNRMQSRSDAIAEMLFKMAIAMGFGSQYEGQGRLKY